MAENISMKDPKDKVLFNPELMAMILKSLSSYDIKKTRLVCQQWSKFGWEIIRKKSVVKLFNNGGDNLQNYMDNFKEQKEMMMGFNYRFYGKGFKNKETMREFFTTFGSEIRFLDLKYSNFDLDVNSQSTLRNLEYLSLNCSQIEFPVHPGFILKGNNTTLKLYEGESLKQFKWLHPLLAEFIRQNSLGLKNLIFSSPITWKVEAMEMIVNSGIKHLDRLEFERRSGGLNDESLTILGGGGITFKKLSISLDQDHTPSLMALMLNNSKNTLEDLNLDCHNISIAPLHLQKLKKLIVLQYKGILSVFGRNNFPLLEDLHIRFLKFEGKRKDLVGEGAQNETMKCCDLWIDGSVNMVTLLNHVSNVFPTLRSLSIHCSKVMETHLGFARNVFEDLRKCELCTWTSLESNFVPLKTYEFDLDKNPLK